MLRRLFARLLLAASLAVTVGALAVSGAAQASSLPPMALPPVEPATPVVSVPVLMYHHIGSPIGHLADFGYYVPLSAFQAQMAYLADAGFTAVSLDQVLAALQGQAPLPPHPVAITFDDGNQDNYGLALPVLEAYHLTATFFIVTGWVGTPGHLTWPEIAAMQQAGMYFGAHTVSHPYLPFLSTAQARTEIWDSKSVLETHLGQWVQIFAYPYGHTSPMVTALVQSAGFRLALGTSPYSLDHTLAERFYLTRYGVYRWTSLGAFERRLPPPIWPDN